MCTKVCWVGISPPIRCGVVAYIMLAFMPLAAYAQSVLPQLPDTAVPRRPVYGIGLDEFLIAARHAVAPDPGHTMAQVWELARELNISTWEPVNLPLADLDAMRDGAEQGERLIPNLQPIGSGGQGREVVFFPFDSAQSYYWQNHFRYRTPGNAEAEYNRTVLEKDPRFAPQERIYSVENTTPDETILAHVVYGYSPARQTHRYPDGPYDPAVENSSLFLESRVDWTGNPHTYYIEVKGHLYNPDDGGGTAVLSDTLLTVELWNEIPKGTSYIDSSGNRTSDANDDLEFLYRTYYLTKSSFQALGVPPDYDAYHDAQIPVDLWGGSPGMGGPLQSAVRRFDIRLRWTGREKIALRSITLRDSIGQLMHDGGPAGLAYRTSYADAASRAMYGSSQAPGGTWRDSMVIAFYSGDEGHLTTNLSFNAVDSTLYTTFPSADPAVRGVRAYRAMAWLDTVSQHTLTSMDLLTVETYFTDIAWPPGGPQQYFGLPPHLIQAPAIARHNGGEYGIPLLPLKPDSIEAYTDAIQRQRVGAYYRGGNNWPYMSQWAYVLGHAAWASRRTGKRLIQWPGVHSSFYIRYEPVVDGNGDTIDYQQQPLLSHMPEASELRMMINLGLAYGSRGVHYSWMGTQHNQIVDDPRYPGNPNRRFFYTDHGVIGPTLSDRENHYSSVLFETPSWVTPYESYEFHDFYTGWGNRLDELRWMGNDWLPRIGAAMAKLQWRDAYSWHFTTEQTWMQPEISYVAQTRVRPFPESDIISSIRARSRTGVLDAPMRTYVEVGLFDKVGGVHPVTGVTDPLYDTTYVFLVNRRSFERPGDVEETSAEGRLMDSLAEMRTLLVTFNLKHPDPTQYNYLHIREIEPDATPLPLTGGVPRAGLDTIIYADSVLALTLRPGGGALLRITYCQPGDTIGPGDTRFNSQKKIVFDGQAYHTVYWRKATGAPHKDTIYYRKSLPVTSETGAIRWHVFEYPVVPDQSTGNFRTDCFPSLTVRTKPHDTIVTVVWSSGQPTVIEPRRSIRLRQITWNGNAPEAIQMGPVEDVAFYDGDDPEQWGTPVVSSLHGGDMIAWSDEEGGIIVRLRRPNGGYGRPDTISRWIPGLGSGKYPSMPAYAHVAGRDSSTALVWQEPAYNGTLDDPIGSIINYVRLVDTVTALGDTILKYNAMTISHNDAMRHEHPSIDRTQDLWQGAQEGVTWESYTNFYDQTKGLDYTRTWVHFSSLWTDISGRYNDATDEKWHPYWDSIGQAWQWTYNKMMVATVPGFNLRPSVYPSTGSLNHRIDQEHGNEKIYFGLVMGPRNNPSLPMRQAMVEYATSFLWSSPQWYAFGGYNPSLSVSPVRQGSWAGALYQLAPGSRSTLNTTRQFFAKEARPVGYLARGRQMYVRIDEPGHTGMTATLHDVWVAGPGQRGPLALAERSPELRRTDSLDDVRYLFTSEPFTAYDSTTIGLELAGNFVGDTALGAGMAVDYIAEVVNVSSGEVVHLFDSFTVAAGAVPHFRTLADEVDLLSGVYVVRLRMEPHDLHVAEVPYDSRFPVEELTAYIGGEEAYGKLERGERAAAGGRISVWPNPARGMTEIRFTVPVVGEMAVTLYDAGGREVLRPVERTTMMEGRYSVTADLSALAAGTYLLELRSGSGPAMRRTAEKIVISR